MNVCVQNLSAYPTSLKNAKCLKVYVCVGPTSAYQFPKASQVSSNQIQEPSMRHPYSHTHQGKRGVPKLQIYTLFNLTHCPKLSNNAQKLESRKNDFC